MTISKWEVPPYRKENLMRLFYVILDLEQQKLSDLFNCSETTIRKWKKKHELEIEKNPYKDEEQLREAVHQGLTYKEIADKLNTTAQTVCSYVQKFGIEPLSESVEEMAEMYNDGKSLNEIGEEFNCSRKTVSRRLRENGYEIRDRDAWNHGTGTYLKSKPDYEVIRHTIDGNQYEVLHHRLVAVSEYGFDSVVGKDIHHKNHIPWDNRPSNLIPMSSEKHARLHGLRNAAKAKGKDNWQKITL